MLSGEFTVVNQHLLMDLTRLGLWSPDLKNELVAANGSIQVCSLPLPMLQTDLPLAHALCRLATCACCVILSNFGMFLARHELQSVVLTVTITIKLWHEHAALMYSGSLDARG